MMELSEKYGLGRNYAPDPRNKKYLMKSLLPKEEIEMPDKRYWNDNGAWGNQGNTNQCVGFAFFHYLFDGPVTQNRKTLNPAIHPTAIYTEANRNDPWAPVPHEGTTIGAGADYVKKQGYISSYYWGNTMDELLKWLFTKGPLIVGTSWYTGMFKPDSNGFIKPTGIIEGGHATVINGGNMKQEKVRGKNSWGTGWGDGGNFWLTFEDLEKLIDPYAEFCIAQEIKIK